MSKKSWVAITGLCVLMATSAAQAHPIPVSVENFEAGPKVSGAFEATDRAHTLRVLGQQSSVGGLISGSPLRTSSEVFGKRGHSIVDRICGELPPANKVPEPETLALLMAGLLGVAVTGRRRKPAAQG